MMHIRSAPVDYFTPVVAMHCCDGTLQEKFASQVYAEEDAASECMSSLVLTRARLCTSFGRVQHLELSKTPEHGDVVCAISIAGGRKTGRNGMRFIIRRRRRVSLVHGVHSFCQLSSGYSTHTQDKWSFSLLAVAVWHVTMASVRKCDVAEADSFLLSLFEIAVMLGCL